MSQRDGDPRARSSLALAPFLHALLVAACCTKPDSQARGREVSQRPIPRDPGRWLRPHPAASGPGRTGAGAAPPEPALPVMAPGGPGGGRAQPASSGSQGNRCSGRAGTWPYPSLQENSQGEAALSGLSGSFGTGPPTRAARGPRAAGLTQPEPGAAQVLGQPHSSPALKELGADNRLQLSWNPRLRSETPVEEGEETRRASPRERGAGSPGGPEDERPPHWRGG